MAVERAQEPEATELPQETETTEPLQELEVLDPMQEAEAMDPLQDLEATGLPEEPVAMSLPEERWGDHQVEWPEQWRDGSAGSDREQRVPHEDMSEVGAESVPENTRQAPEESAPPLTPAERPIVPARPQHDTKAHATKTSDPPALPETSRWGDDIEWPEEWRK